jgi:hypothetical protein
LPTFLSSSYRYMLPSFLLALRSVLTWHKEKLV